jgi:FeS assembly SUF system regulator
MVRISKLSDYAIQLLAAFVREPPLALNARDVSGLAGIPEPTVKKLLKLLSRAGLLESRRGALGGYRLSRDPEAITITEIIAAVDGPIALTECNEPGGDRCVRQTVCPLRGNWQRVNKVIEGALSHLTLSQMAGTLSAWPAGRGGNP